MNLSIGLIGVPLLWRAMHDKETGGIWRTGVPEVYQLWPQVEVPLTEAWQRLIFEMNQPGMTGTGFRSLLAHDRAFSNGSNGYNSVPLADFINGRDLSTPFPALDKPRFCGGAILTGQKQGRRLLVETLDGSQDPPSWEWLRVRPWLYFEAVNVTLRGITRFPQRGGLPVYMPLVAIGEVSCPFEDIHLNGQSIKLQAWPLGALPDAHKFYP